MKRMMLFLLLATIAVYFSGCSTYQNYLSYKKDEELSRERAKVRQEVALREIRSGEEVVSQDGSLLGGSPVIFINDTREEVRIFVTKLEGDLRGYSWSFLIPRGLYKESKLGNGNYSIQWTIHEDYYTSSFYPRIPATFPVTRDSHFFYDQTGKRYNGGYQILRN